jgi:hypothetical protein
MQLPPLDDDEEMTGVTPVTEDTEVKPKKKGRKPKVEEIEEGCEWKRVLTL